MSANTDVDASLMRSFVEVVLLDDSSQCWYVTAFNDESTCHSYWSSGVRSGLLLSGRSSTAGFYTRYTQRHWRRQSWVMCVYCLGIEPGAGLVGRGMLIAGIHLGVLHDAVPPELRGGQRHQSSLMGFARLVSATQPHLAAPVVAGTWRKNKKIHASQDCGADDKPWRLELVLRPGIQVQGLAGKLRRDGGILLSRSAWRVSKILSIALDNWYWSSQGLMSIAEGYHQQIRQAW